MSEQPNQKRKRHDLADTEASKWPCRRRRRQVRGDRIMLDVGGDSFWTTKSTLCGDSSFFNAFFSTSWRHESDDGYDDDNQQNEAAECYLDQDPETFPVLLEYMRLGMIHVDELTPRVVLLAEFLGMDTLLTAIKVQSIKNVEAKYQGSDEEAVNRFDEKYGGLRSAISNAILPNLLLQKTDNFVKEYANLTIVYASCRLIVTSNIVGLQGAERRPFLSFALNLLGRHGFNHIEESGLEQADDNAAHDVVFSRMVPVRNDSSATQVLIKATKTTDELTTTWKRKQYAVMYRLFASNMEILTFAVDDEEARLFPIPGEFEITEKRVDGRILLSKSETLGHGSASSKRISYSRKRFGKEAQGTT